MRARSWFLLLSMLPMLLLAGFGGWLYKIAREAEPSYTGNRVLSGLRGPVEVIFGPHAVPYLRAAESADLFLAQGYLEASERMWQMDLLRRLPRGRLAELFGSDAVAADTFFRTLGLGRIAEESLAALAPEVRAHLDAYTAGVNAYLGAAAGRLPLEYRLSGTRPEPWTPADSLAIGVYMAFSLSSNARQELLFWKLAGRLGGVRAAELFPIDEGMPAPVPDWQPGAGVVGLAARWRAVDGFLAEHGLPRPGVASNSWLLAGERTVEGFPLLVNDPHLAPTLPSIWYELELESPGLHVVGVSLPGVPFVLIGHNEEVAWGLTTVTADTQDLVIERVLGEGDAVARPQGGAEVLSVREEHIHVKDQDEPVVLRVRSSSNGVILDDLLANPAGTPYDFASLDAGRDTRVALRWNLDRPDRSLEGIYRLNTARTTAEVRQAAALIRHVAQNLIYVHRNGAGGWQMTGALPQRIRGDGTFPVRGWEGGDPWRGYLPAESNPGADAPRDDGTLVIANNRTLPRSHPLRISSGWMPPYRAQRIEALLASRAHWEPGDMGGLMMDQKGPEVQRYQGAVASLQAAIAAVDPEAWTIARTRLLPWDGRFAPDSAAAAFFVLLRPALSEALFGDELGPDLAELMAVSPMSYNALQEVVYSGESSFWDDIRTAAVETPAEIWARALRAAEAEMRRRQGPDAGDWRLDRLRYLEFPHAFRRVPVLGRYLGVGPLGIGGDDHTVNVSKASLKEPERVAFIASYRVVMTPGDWAATAGTNTLGQSGHRFSPHRTDQFEDWRLGRLHLWSWGGPAPERIIGRLRLEPEGT